VERQNHSTLHGSLSAGYWNSTLVGTKGHSISASRKYQDFSKDSKLGGLFASGPNTKEFWLDPLPTLFVDEERVEIYAFTPWKYAKPSLQYRWLA